MARSKHISYKSLYRAAAEYCVSKGYVGKDNPQLLAVVGFLNWFWKQNKEDENEN